MYICKAAYGLLLLFFFFLSLHPNFLLLSFRYLVSDSD